MPPSATLGVAVSSSVVASTSSVIVAVPTALALAVVPAVTVAVSEKVSSPSAATSSLVATRICTLVLPAAIVTPPTGTATQAVPLKYSSAVAVSVPTVAVPLDNVGLKVTAAADGLDSDTVKTARPPSPTVGELTASVGVSSSVIVVVCAPLAPLMARLSKLPPEALAIVTVKFSAPSPITSCKVAMLKLALLAPAGIVTEATPV